MIHLDANILIRAAQKDSQVQSLLKNWLQRGESFSVSAIVWAEFLNGPLNAENKADGNFLIQGRVVSFGRTESEIASTLFNATKRKRGSMPDCLIAAAAISARAPLATLNKRDFTSFAAFGLQLA